MLTDPIAVPEWKGRRHEVFYYLNLVAEIERRILGRDTVSTVYPDISLQISAERRAEALATLVSHGIDAKKQVVAIGPGSTNSRAKRWPALRYAELCDRLNTELDVNVVLVGAKNEADVADAVTGSMKTKATNLVGKTDLDTVVAILSEADLMISNDMGLAHVAPSVGTKTIAIFGPTNPETTRPFSTIANVVRESVDCSPCMLRDCPIDHRCMIGITVENIFNSANEMLFPDLIDEEFVESPLYLLD